jgi:hypothetical protein
MALIDCPECGHEVSDSAVACPACAFPMTAPTDKTPEQRPPTQTVELTGKKWKGLQLWSVLAMLAGLLFGLVEDPRLTLVFCIPGLIGIAIAKAGAWWHHR